MGRTFALVGLGLIGACLWLWVGRGTVRAGGGLSPEGGQRVEMEPNGALVAGVRAMQVAEFGEREVLPRADWNLDLPQAQPKDAPKDVPLGGLAELVADLKDDEVRWNATEARRKLAKEWSRARGLLEEALDSVDLQQRQYAAELLLPLLKEREAPPDRLMEVLLEALEDRHVDQYNSAKVVSLALTESPQDVGRWLRPALQSKDTQQRFLCAAILAWRKDVSATGQVCSVLIEHLNDNDFWGDAKTACNALYTLGAPALPFLRGARALADEQGRELIDLTILNICAPPLDEADRFERMRALETGSLMMDPTREGIVGRVFAVSVGGMRGE